MQTRNQRKTKSGCARALTWGVLLLSLYLYGAAETGSAPSIDPVVDLARTAPPQLASDALIRVAALDRVPKARRIELLEQAFQLAAASPAPYKRYSAVSHSQGPSGFLDRVYAQDLDALSLRLRTVEGLLAVDPLKARERFEEIPPLDLPDLTCDDFLVYDVSRFYDVLGEVAAQGFTPKEIKEEQPAKFLAGYLGRIAHPAEVAPAARLLVRNLPLTDAQFQSVVTAFASALSSIAGDDRSFTAAAAQAESPMESLAAASERKGLSPVIVLGSFRNFLVSHLTAVRCEDTEPKDPAASLATYFNEHLRPPALPPIDDNESKPAKREGKAQGLTWCQDPECQAMRDRFHALVFKDTGEAVEEPQRASAEWEAKVRDFLSAMAGWTDSSGSSPIEFFREKEGFYSDLLVVVPNGETREYVLRSLLAFLLESRPASEDAIQWYLPVTQLVGRVALDPLGLGKTADDLRQSNDSAIALELALEFLAPRPLNKFMLLL
jgi:hypothetical protein